MNDDKFNMLTYVLEKLEKAAINQSSIKNAINEIVDDFSTNLNKEQKHKISRELNDHEKIVLEQSFEQSNIG